MILKAPNKNQDNQDDRYVDLLSHLPSFYHDSKEIKELQTILGNQVGNFRGSLDEMINQCFISTSTLKIDRWEKIYGLQTDRSRTYERRREILLAKLRGYGTTTKEMIKSVAIAFSGGEVDVHEYPKESRFHIQFVGVKGIPQNMDGLINAIEEIKPAHLSFTFEYTFNTWNDITHLTWDEASSFTWEGLRER